MLWVAFVVVLFATIYFWIHTDKCESLETSAEYLDCHAKQGPYGSEMFLVSVRIIVTLLLVLVTLKIAGLKVLPVLTFLGFCIAGAGFALKEILSDYFCGVGILFGRIIEYNDTVILSIYGRTVQTGPLRIDRFHSFFLEATSLEKTTAPSKVFIRYSHIQRVDRLIDLPTQFSDVEID